MKKTLAQNLILLLWVALMASSFVVSKQLLPFANPIASTGLRFMLASLFMLPFIWQGHARILTTKLMIQYTIISLFLVLFFLGLFEALKTTTPIRTSVIYTLLPLLSVVSSYLALTLTTPKIQLVGFVLGTCGAIWVLLIFNPGADLLEKWVLGDGIFLLACSCLAIHVTLIKKWTVDVAPAQGAFYIMLAGSILLLPFLLSFGDLNRVALQQPAFWQALLYLTVFTTMATFFLQQYLLKKVGPNRLLAFTYLVPSLVAIPQALSAKLPLYNGLPGLILTLLALYLISRQGKQDACDLVSTAKIKQG
jgi:drug/metabolite transporter (DMT)-like permease